MSKFGFTFFLVLGLAANASAAINLDGNISAGEWDGFIVTSDPADDNPTGSGGTNGVEMTRWGAKVEGNYLFWFCEIADLTFDEFLPDQGGSTECYPAITLNTDNSTTTYMASGSVVNFVDSGKKEWGTQLGGVGNHRGVDLFIEWGSDMAADTGQPVNYWGGSGDVGNVIAGGSDSAWSMGTSSTSNVLECKVKIDDAGSSNDMADALVASANAAAGGEAVLGDYWEVAVAIQGQIKAAYAPSQGAYDWGYDVGTPTAIAKDPTTKDLYGGDFDLDGDVDVSDLGILATNYGNTTHAMTWREGDCNRDGVVDVSDLGILATNYGAGTTAAVPEPATLALMGLGVLTLLLWRRKK